MTEQEKTTVCLLTAKLLIARALLEQRNTKNAVAHFIEDALDITRTMIGDDVDRKAILERIGHACNVEISKLFLNEEDLDDIPF